MVRKEFWRSALVNRVDASECPFEIHEISVNPTIRTSLECISLEWVSELILGLDAADCDVSKLCEVFVELSQHPKLSQVRSELSRIPVWYRLCEYSKLSANGFSTYLVKGGRAVSGQTYELSSSKFPKSVLPAAIDQASFAHGTCVPCFYDIDLARALGLELVPYWPISDSIVDWLSEFAQTEGLRSEPRLSVVPQDDDVCYQLSYRGRCLSNTDGDSAVDHIYRFIVQNAPVTTSDIIALEIVSRRQTFNLIRQLEKVDKIERIGHGKYIAL